MNKAELVYLSCFIALVGSYVQIVADNIWRGKAFQPLWYYIVVPIVAVIVIYIVLYFTNRKKLGSTKK